MMMGASRRMNVIMGRMVSQQQLLVKRREFLSVAAAAAILTLSNSSKGMNMTRSMGEQSRIPSRFGASIALKSDGQHRKSSSLSNIDTRNKDDCPVCKKFSQGPCGEVFKTWMACTDQYPDKNPDNPQEDLHISKCRHLAIPLGSCLEKHESYYDELDVDAVDNAEEEQLMDAWNKVIVEVEESRKPTPFPSPPELEIRLSNNTGMASFEYGISGKRIVMTYVRDDDTGMLLAAGSMDDLWDYKGKGILRLSVPPSCSSVTAYALYIDEDDNDILYHHCQKVPRT